MLQYNIVMNTQKDLGTANQVLLTFLKNNRNDDLLANVAVNYLKMGRESEAIKLLKQRLEQNLYAVGYLNQMADFYFERRNYSEALIYQNRCLEIAPYHGYYFEKIGKIEEAQGNIEEAKDAYAKAIYYSPSNYSARKQLRKLEKQADLFAGFDCPDPVKVLK